MKVNVKWKVCTILVGVAFMANSGPASANPILIGSQAELENISSDPTLDYALSSDFEVLDPVSGLSHYIDGYFTGTFDGGGYTISGLTRPLFYAIGNNDVFLPTNGGEVSNLKLVTDDLGILGQGILANAAHTGSVIENVDVEGLVITQYDSTGGLVGFSNAEISNSSANVTIQETSTVSQVGGLVGYSTYNITESTANVEINVTGDLVGGLVGQSNALIESSFSTGSVQGANYVGGLAGYSYFDIVTSHSEASVTGNLYVGGLTGVIQNANIINSYSSNSEVTASSDYSGGLSGWVDNTSITNSFSKSNVTGNVSVGGLIGYSSNSDISNSYATGDVISFQDSYVESFIGLSSSTTLDFESRGFGQVTRTVMGSLEVTPASTDTRPNQLTVINSDFLTNPYGLEACRNGGDPFVVAIIETYQNTCSNSEPSLDFIEKRTIVKTGIRTLVFSDVPEASKLTLLLESNLIQYIAPNTIMDGVLFEINSNEKSILQIESSTAFQISIDGLFLNSLYLEILDENGFKIVNGNLYVDENQVFLPPLKIVVPGNYTFVFLHSINDQKEILKFQVKVL